MRNCDKKEEAEEEGGQRKWPSDLPPCLLSTEDLLGVEEGEGKLLDTRIIHIKNKYESCLS